MDEVRETLEYYSKLVADCRKVTSEGDKARAALDKDGGIKARWAMMILDGRTVNLDIERARAEGREACAKVTEGYPCSATKPLGQSIAKRIRARSLPRASEGE